MAVSLHNSLQRIYTDIIVHAGTVVLRFAKILSGIQGCQMLTKNIASLGQVYGKFLAKNL